MVELANCGLSMEHSCSSSLCTQTTWGMFQETQNQCSILNLDIHWVIYIFIGNFDFRMLLIIAQITGTHFYKFLCVIFVYRAAET